MIIDKGLVEVNLEVKDKYEAIEWLANLAGMENRLSDRSVFCQKVREREEQVSTDMGFGIAIPHGKTDAVKDPFVAVAKLRDPIIWNEETGSKIDLIFMLGSPATSEDNVHLVIMSELARRLMDDEFLKEIRSAERPETILKYFDNLVSVPY
ncbi:MAG TPA: PTS mannose transporter subunit IIAB [Lachnoclostridium sp.]|uniref:PTS sugar transporter subunit IIA n=1 Tax=Lacrimispora sp. TaxID=2719234 RepID=UPI000EE1C253|nr:fructose PTS transporter subunit IIA [Lacrimispora sp.]HCD45081.1 PTS mannose transporter subunit IIAB [Lachnoclostridium sp.]